MGNVHLPVEACERAIGVDHHRAVVVDPLGASLKDRSDDHHLMLCGESLEALSGWSRNRLGELEVRGILTLRKVARPKEFLETDHLRSVPRSGLDRADRALQIRRLVLAASTLDKREPHSSLRSVAMGSTWQHAILTVRNMPTDQRNPSRQKQRNKKTTRRSARASRPQRSGSQQRAS